MIVYTFSLYYVELFPLTSNNNKSLGDQEYAGWTDWLWKENSIVVKYIPSYLMQYTKVRKTRQKSDLSVAPNFKKSSQE